MIVKANWMRDSRNTSSISSPIRVVHASIHGSFLMGPVTFTQNRFEYFAGATLRQLGVQELDPARNLVIGNRAPAVSHQIIRDEDLSRLQHDTAHHKLTP